jgi:hypothetical protein
VNLGILSLRLLVIDCVGVEGSSWHAKLVSWSSRENSERFDPCRLSSSAYDDHWTYRLHEYVMLEVWWIHYWICELCVYSRCALLMHFQCDLWELIKPLFLVSVQKSYPVNPFEDCCNLGKCPPSRALEECNK